MENETENEREKGEDGGGRQAGRQAGRESDVDRTNERTIGRFGLVRFASNLWLTLSVLTLFTICFVAFVKHCML